MDLLKEEKMSNNNLTDLTAYRHEKRIQQIREEVKNIDSQELAKRIKNLTHSEKAYERLLQDIANENGELDESNN